MHSLGLLQDGNGVTCTRGRFGGQLFHGALHSTILSALEVQSQLRDELQQEDR